MSNLTISTNISPSISYSYRYHKSSDVIPVWTSGTSTSSTFTVATPDSLGTNYTFEIYNNCTGSVTSGTSTFSTNYFPPSIVQSLVIGYGSTAINVNNGLCNSADNSYIFWFDVSYTGARNDLNVVTSQIRLVLDGKTYYFTPSYANSVGLTSTLSNGNTYLGEIFYVTGLNSDASLKNLTVDFVSGGASGLSQSFTAPAPCSVASGNLILYAVGSNSTVRINDLNLTTSANIGTSSTIANVPFGNHSLTITDNCVNFASSNINGVLYGSPGNVHTYNVSTSASTPNISINVTCN